MKEREGGKTMAARLADLRAQAKRLGIPSSEIRSASSVRELRDLIAEYDTPKRTVKRTVKKAVAKKATAKKQPVRRGRPPKAKAVTTRKAAPARSRKSGTAKRRPAASGNGDGRHLLGRVNYKKRWNAREGSAPDQIIKALAKYNGDREKVYSVLVKRVWDFTNKIKRDGSRRTLPEAQQMLKYRIARTAWDFAIQTGQHDKATDRVEYGTGGTGNGTWKPVTATRKATTRRKVSTTRKASTVKKAGAARRGRPAKAAVVKRGRPAKAAGAKRGRPVGSKNKTTTRARGRAAARR
jgi:hypothetical protein